jgi:spore maturation protein CgeB
MGEAAKRRVLAEHTYAHRALQVEAVLGFAVDRKASLAAREQVA